jgi:hypothetical protein
MVLRAVFAGNLECAFEAGAEIGHDGKVLIYDWLPDRRQWAQGGVTLGNGFWLFSGNAEQRVDLKPDDDAHRIHAHILSAGEKGLAYSRDGKPLAENWLPKGAAGARGASRLFGVSPKGSRQFSGVGMDNVRIRGTLHREWLEAQLRRGQPGSGLEEVQKLFKGKVEDFDPATGRITLSYDFKGGIFSNSELKADWAVTTTLFDGQPAPRGHLAVFAGDLEFVCKQFIAAHSFIEKGHGGVAWQREDAKWDAFKVGLNRVQDEKKTYAQIYQLSQGRERKEVPIPVQERPCVETVKMANGQQVIFSVDGAELMRAARPFRDAALRPLLPNSDAIMAVRLVGTLQKAWLEEQLNKLKSGSM